MRSLLISALLVLLFPAFGQTVSPLSRVISIEANKEKAATVLASIAREGKFSFSYNSTIISEDQLVTIDAQNKTVREILDEIFKGALIYKEKSSHIILSKAPVKTSQSSSTVITGFVEDSETKERIASASVYDKKTMTSVTTDDQGYFKIKLESKGEAQSIAVSKLNYKDTTTIVAMLGKQNIIIPVSRIKVTQNDSVRIAPTDSLRKEEAFMPYEDEPNILNIHDTLYQDIQIAILPFVGSNGKLSGNVINNYSINMLAGYSLGTRQIELGFFINMDRGDVSWLQVAGIGNLVGRNVYGIQGSGFFNLNGGETKAAQFTGGVNIDFEDFQGVQISGLTNMNLRSADGVLVSGLANFVHGPSKGVEVAGLGNFQWRDYNGSQFAGLTNFATRHITGSQISVLFNYGRTVHGTQIGLVNFADTLGGVPIGLFSFVKSGYHKIEVSADEVFYSNLAFRSGVKKFYNILFAGIKPEQMVNNNTSVWTFGYGIGTAPGLTRWLDLNVDLTTQHVNNGGFTSELSLLTKLHLGLDFRLAKKLSIYSGVTLNGYLTNAAYSDYPVLFTDFHPSVFSDNTFSNGNNLKMWWGAKIGLRIL